MAVNVMPFVWIVSSLLSQKIPGSGRKRRSTPQFLYQDSPATEETNENANT